MVSMAKLTPIIIGRWADECEEDDYVSDAFRNGEEAICQTGVSTAQVEQLKAVAAALLTDSSEAAKQQEGKTEDGNNSPCCVLSSQSSIIDSRASTAPSSPRSQTEPWSTGPASRTNHLQAPAAQPMTARERLEEAMRKHGFGRPPSEFAAAAQVSTSTFASRDYRVHERPIDTIKQAAQRLQHAHDAQKVNSARPATGQLTPLCPGSSCRSAGGGLARPTSIPAPALQQSQGNCPTGRPPRRSERGKSVHDSGARSAFPREPAEHDIPSSTIKNRPVRGTSAKACLPSMPGGLRMLQQSVHASAAERGCPPSRRHQPARQQQQQDKLASALSGKAAHPQDEPPLSCVAEPMQQDTEASFAVAAEPAEQQKESSSPPSTEATSCMPAPLQFGTAVWDSSRHCAMDGQPDEPQQQLQVHMQHKTRPLPIWFGSFTEQEAEDLRLFAAATEPAQQHASPTAPRVSAEAVTESSTGGPTQSRVLANYSSTDPEVVLDSTPTGQLTWPLALPLQACSLAQTCSRWMLPKIMQPPINMAVNATVNVLAATSAAIDFCNGQQH
ncbi:hypothetical protein COCOBI_07-4500 [Coccomyxa sp. Obi]|nr:hypothetical protein COCOBI_07-4500 [Coccomyxa sp. Obi]